MMNELLKQMKKLKIGHSYDTFAAQLLVIGSQKTHKPEEIQEILQQMDKQVQ